MHPNATRSNAECQSDDPLEGTIVAALLRAGADQLYEHLSFSLSTEDFSTPVYAAVWEMVTNSELGEPVSSVVRRVLGDAHADQLMSMRPVRAETLDRVASILTEKSAKRRQEWLQQLAGRALRAQALSRSGVWLGGAA